MPTLQVDQLRQGGRDAHLSWIAGEDARYQRLADRLGDLAAHAPGQEGVNALVALRAARHQRLEQRPQLARRGHERRAQRRTRAARHGHQPPSPDQVPLGRPPYVDDGIREAQCVDQLVHGRVADGERPRAGVHQVATLLDRAHLAAGSLFAFQHPKR